MSKVKDLMHAILNEGIEEEEEIVEEENEVEVEPVQQLEPTFVEPIVKPVQEEPVIASFLTDKKEIKKETKKPSIFDGMDYEEISSEMPGKKTKKSEYHYDRSKMKKLRKPLEDFDYSPVISPIFGNTKEEAKEFDKVHNAIDLQKPGDDFTFTKVISPMYGNDLPTPKPVQQIPVKKPAVKKNNVDYTLKEMLSTPNKKESKQKSLFEEE
ncbi:hypothetical protein [Floccifex sp.]|uniref:hypothetical protein n=1 Tax=Floccifex sp. TaxID=2815810 RepID=UPI003F0178BF